MKTTHPDTAELTPDVLARAKQIRLIMFDSDGVFTDGRITTGAGGEDLRSFDVKDGHGLVMARHGGLILGIMSGRVSEALAKRAAELKIAEIHQGVLDKGTRLIEVLERLQIPAEQTCFVGDDLIDIPALRRVGLAVAPADAVTEVRNLAHHVTQHSGGRGALRELIEGILQAQGKWDDVIRRYYE